MKRIINEEILTRLNEVFIKKTEKTQKRLIIKER